MQLPLATLERIFAFNTYPVDRESTDLAGMVRVKKVIVSYQQPLADTFKCPTEMPLKEFDTAISWLNVLQAHKAFIDSKTGLCQGNGDNKVTWRELEALAALSETPGTTEGLDDQDFLVLSLSAKPTLKLNPSGSELVVSPMGRQWYQVQEPFTIQTVLQDKTLTLTIPKDFVSNGFHSGKAAENYRRFQQQDNNHFDIGVVHDYLLQQVGQPTQKILSQGATPSEFGLPEMLDKATVNRITRALLVGRGASEAEQNTLLLGNSDTKAERAVAQINQAPRHTPLPQPKLITQNNERFALVEDYTVEIGDGRGNTYRVTVPQGYWTDGASVPKFTRALGFINDGYMLAPALVHDYLYEYHSTLNTDWRQGTVQQKQPDGSFKPIEAVSRRTADGIFKAMMKANDVPANGAVQHAAVRLFSNASFLHYNWDDFTKAHEAADRAAQKTAQYNQSQTPAPKD